MAASAISNGFGLQADLPLRRSDVGFDIPHGPTISFSPNFGLNDNSVRVLYRFTVSYEVQQLFGHFHRGAR